MNKKLIALILCIFCLTSVFALASCGGNRDTDTDVPSEIVIYLDVKGGTMNFSQEFEWNANEDIEYLPTPTKEGYDFLGWSLNGEIVTVPFSASEDILLVAEWKAQNSGDTSTDTETDTETETDDPNLPYYTVTFDPKGGTFSGELTIQVQEGKKIPQPANPVYEGKIFNGWYSGTSTSSRWDFETMTVTGDVTLTAWYQGGTVCAHDETVPVPEKSYAATCEKGGKEYSRCVKCGLTTFVNTTKLGHDLITEVIPETCATDGYTHVYCSREGCDEDRTHSTVPATGNHTYGSSYVTLVSPTQYVGGKEAKVCVVCGGTQIFKIPSIAEMDELLWDLDIGNYTYTGGEYVNESFVDIAKNAGLSASSYYTVCLAKNAIDGGSGTFWCADTLADGAKFTGDTLVMTFAEAYDIGMIKLTVPHYSAWELGEDCYVAYDLEAMIDGEWQLIGVLSDKNAVSAGTGGAIIYELDAPINTDQLRFTVNHSTRNAPAMIYEIEVMAAVESTERVSQDLINSSSLSSSGKYNSWATGTETLMDSSYDTFWNSNYKDKATVGEIFTAITFPEEKFVTAVQFAVAPNCNKQFSVYYLDTDGETWIKACTYNVVRGANITLSGDSNGDGEVDGQIIEVGTDDDGNIKKRALFTCDIAKFTSKVKLVIDNHDADKWSAYVYEFVPYTAVEQGAGLPSYVGCAHNSFKLVETVTPGCTTAGYSIMECYGCGYRCTTDAVDAYGHTWGSYVVATAAEGESAGTKESCCLKDNCDAVRTTSYYNDYEDPKITTYRYNAPAAWAQTLDDGNYLATYEWVIPKLQSYGWKATAVLSVCYVDMYVSEWQGYLASGALDIGSHSYTHGGYYSGQISENSLLSDVVNAHYWFMNNFAGQRILGFATPNGQTSTGTSEYVTGIMAGARNGGNSKYFYNVIEELAGNGEGKSPYVGSIAVDEETGEVIFTQATNKEGELTWVSTRRAWGNLNSYISKSDQSEGAYAFAKKDGTLSSTSYQKITQVAVIDETTGEQAVDENGNLVWETLKTPVYEETSGGYDYENGAYTFNEKGGAYALIKAPNGTYHYVERAGAGVNYVYDEETNRLADKGTAEGTYRYFETYKDGALWDAYYEWVDVGSYDYTNGEFVFRADNNGQYKLNHTSLGSYEKGINEILSVGGMTVECLHEIGQYGSIWSSYASTNSKFKYLDQTGIWVCSYTELIQYMKEELNATLTLVERTDSKVVLTLTDTLDDYMYNLPLTIEVDVDDAWISQYGIVATQNGAELSFFTENGKVYVDAVPDAGDIIITPAILCKDGTVNHHFDWDVITEATCTETGLQNGTCSLCGYYASGVVIEATGHTFNEEWTLVSEADCTNPTKYENICLTCGDKEYNITEEAFGHTYTDWSATFTDGNIEGTSICSVCEQEVSAPLTNITADSFKTPVAQGSAWGSDTAALINGDYTDTPIAPKEGGAYTVTLEAGVATYVDAFAVTGFGYSEYSVTVYYENGESAIIGTGSFGENGTETTVFTVSATVTKFVVTMENPSNGSDKWSELSALVVSND